MNQKALASSDGKFLLPDHQCNSAFQHITHLFAVMRVVGIGLSIRLESQKNWFHRILLRVGNQPAKLTLLVGILLDSIILSSKHNRLVFRFAEKGGEIRAKRFQNNRNKFTITKLPNNII